MIAGVQQALVVVGPQQHAAFLDRAEPVEAHRVEPLEDVAVLAVAGGVTVLLHEPLDFLEACDDPFLSRRPSDRLLGLSEVRELGGEFVQVDSFSHTDLRSDIA